jgi:hypothetical protein
MIDDLATQLRPKVARPWTSGMLLAHDARLTISADSCLQMRRLP